MIRAAVAVLVLFVALAAAPAEPQPQADAELQSLRERMQFSALMDTPRFTRQIEAAYRQMWRAWCAKQTASPG